MSSRHGFGLIEFLVVIAVVAIAAAFLSLKPAEPLVQSPDTGQAQSSSTAPIDQQAPVSTPSKPSPIAAPKAARQPATTNNSTEDPIATKDSGTVAPAAGERLVYRNDQYGFSFSFPSTWKGYVVTNETVPGTAGVFDFGFAQQKSIFMIVAYTRGMWDRANHNDLTYYLGSNDRYAFIYNPAEGGADQTMSARLAELKNILATFSGQ